MKVVSCLLLLAFLSVCAAAANLRPIIGILAQPESHENTKDSYIAASYVKFIEGAGGRVVPVNYLWSDEKIKDIFSQVNGFLFPGGGADLSNTSRYYQVQENIVNWAIEATNKGDYFPVWGTCLGFEALSIVISKNFDILKEVDMHNVSLPLEFTEAHKTSRLFGEAPDFIVKAFASLPVTLNNHNFGVLTKDWESNAGLSSFFDVLSINKNRKGVYFVSTIEGKKYPIYGSQWHPEKVLYEWREDEAMNHSYESVLANQYIANFLVNEARKSNHKFADKATEWQSLIYQHTPVYTYPTTADFVQTYFFKN